MRRILAIAVLLIVCIAIASYMHTHLSRNTPVDVNTTAVRQQSDAPVKPDSSIKAALDPGAVVVPDPARSDVLIPRLPPQQVLAKEAEFFVAELTETTVEPLDVDRIDHFISGNQTLSLVPSDSVETTTLRALMEEDSGLLANTPITRVKEVEQVEIVSRERLFAFAAGELSTTVRVMVDDDIVARTVDDILLTHNDPAAGPIRLIKTARYYEITNLGDLQSDTSLSPDDTIRVIRKPYRLETATVERLLGPSIHTGSDTLYYVRTVTADDNQGIWGIVHDALVGNFAQGIALRRGTDIDTFKVTIPGRADEPTQDDKSSFLGHLIHQKVSTSYAYDFKTSQMSRNPDGIRPGEQIVIIEFTAEELISIYQRFAGGNPAED